MVLVLVSVDGSEWSITHCMFGVTCAIRPTRFRPVYCEGQYLLVGSLRFNVCFDDVMDTVRIFRTSTKCTDRNVIVLQTMTVLSPATKALTQTPNVRATSSSRNKKMEGQPLPGPGKVAVATVVARKTRVRILVPSEKCSMHILSPNPEP